MHRKSSLTVRLQSVLDGDYAAVRAKARSFISQPDFLPTPADLDKEKYRELTLDRIRKMVAAGFTKLPYDPQYGGGGAHKDYMNIVEIIAHQDLSLAVKQGVQFGLFGLSVASLGTAKHHKQYLPDIMDGKLLGGFGMTELSGGSDVQAVRTEAVYDHAVRGFVLSTPDENARKAYIGNAARHGQMMVVFAQLKMDKNDKEGKGVHAFLVPIRDRQTGKVLSGVSIEDCGHKAGLNGVDNGNLHFNNIRLPYDFLLDRFASIDANGIYQSDIEKKSQRFFRMIGTLVTGRIFVAMASLSGAKNALTAATEFADKRVVFGNNLLDLQATQARLFPHIAENYALHFATRHLLARQMEGSREVETMAAAIKARASDQSLRAIDECRTLTGGLGYMSEERYGALRNDVDIFRTFEGDNTVLRLLVAKNRLNHLMQHFNHASGFERFAKMAALALRDRLSPFNAARLRKDYDHLLDPDFQRDIFVRRERTMLYALSRKIGALSKKHGFQGAVNKCQTDMLAYADAYADRLMIEQFVKIVKEQADTEVKESLKNVCDLFAIGTMRRNGLWYVENGYMKTGKTRALARLEHKINEKIRIHALDLVRAFGIPEAVLRVSKLPYPQALPKPPIP